MRPKRADETKAQIAQIMAIDAQYSESRVVNEALAEYLPKLMRRFGLEKNGYVRPAQEFPVRDGHL
jgi:hypothetical protein